MRAQDEGREQILVVVEESLERSIVDEILHVDIVVVPVIPSMVQLTETIEPSKIGGTLVISPSGFLETQ